jgi:hypothetical protein
MACLNVRILYFDVDGIRPSFLPFGGFNGLAIALLNDLVCTDYIYTLIKVWKFLGFGPQLSLYFSLIPHASFIHGISLFAIFPLNSCVLSRLTALLSRSRGVPIIL